jgi:putative oxidoreductase
MATPAGRKRPSFGSMIIERPGASMYPETPYSRDFARQNHSERPRRSWAMLAGRALFGGYFLYNGINHLKNRDMMSAYAGSKGIPAPEAAVIGSGALVGLGGLSLLLGIKPKAGLAMIGLFLLGVTPSMHAFWAREDPQERMSERVNFLKNIALIGGATLAAAIPEPWPVHAGNQQARSGV